MRATQRGESLSFAGKSVIFVLRATYVPTWIASTRRAATLSTSCSLGVASGCELCHPSVGRTDGNPARGLVGDDPGLGGPGEPEPEEWAIEAVDTIGAAAVETTPTVSTADLDSVLDGLEL
jgi:hypothetical protein